MYNELIENLKYHPLYNELYKREGIKQCISSGYISENMDDINSRDLLKFNNNNFLKNYNKNKKNIILISTGAYSPVHQGHIDMMLSAKHVALNQGYNVLTIIMSPSHDDYVLKKYVTGQKFNAVERLYLLDKLIAENNVAELQSNSWESIVLKYAVNFTSVISSIENTINRLLPNNNVNYAYVVGSDNVEFCKVFYESKYMCYIVPRVNNNKDLNTYLRDNVFLCPIENTGLSSSMVRNNQYIELNPIEIQNYYSKLIGS